MDTCRDSCCGFAGSVLTPERAALARQAFRLEWLTVAWMIIEGAVAIGAGIAAGSLTLTAFGLDSVIELGSACVLIWRLSVELRHGQAFSARAEQTASMIGGGLLFALAAYIVMGAVWSLWTRHGDAFSFPGLIVALLAIPIMTMLARRKSAIASQRHAGRCGRGCGREHYLRLAIARCGDRPDRRPPARRIPGGRSDIAGHCLVRR